MLLIAPTVASKGGHGTSMRLYALLCVLAQEFSISYLNLGLYRSRFFNHNQSELPGPHRIARSAEFSSFEPDLPYARDHFDVIFVARLVSCPIAEIYAQSPINRDAKLILDADDYESETRLAFSLLAAANGNPAHAAREFAASQSFAAVEQRMFVKVNHLLFSSPKDVSLVKKRYLTASAHHVPNALLNRSSPSGKVSLAEGFTILFAGTMDYFPNSDAAVYFCEEILPMLRVLLRDFELRILIAGARPSSAVRALRHFPGVTVTGEVREIEKYYLQADFLIVPLRAGGGSRMKILEAFTHLCPVVSTSIGAAGLEVKDQEHLLVADSAAEFAAACARLARDHGLRQQLTSCAAAWVVQHHSLNAVRKSLLAAGILNDRG